MLRYYVHDPLGSLIRVAYLRQNLRSAPNAHHDVAFLVIVWLIDVMKQSGERQYLQVNPSALVFLKLSRKADCSVPYSEQVVWLVGSRLSWGFLQDLKDNLLSGGNIIPVFRGWLLAPSAVKAQLDPSILAILMVLDASMLAASRSVG